MQIQIGYDCYHIWDDLKGVSCSKETVQKLNLDTCNQESYDTVIKKIAVKHEMNVSKVRLCALNNQSCH